MKYDNDNQSIYLRVALSMEPGWQLISLYQVNQKGIQMTTLRRKQVIKHQLCNSPVQNLI